MELGWKCCQHPSCRIAAGSPQILTGLYSRSQLLFPEMMLKKLQGISLKHLLLIVNLWDRQLINTHSVENKSLLQLPNYCYPLQMRGLFLLSQQKCLFYKGIKREATTNPCLPTLGYGPGQRDTSLAVQGQWFPSHTCIYVHYTPGKLHFPAKGTEPVHFHHQVETSYVICSVHFMVIAGFLKTSPFLASTAHYMLHFLP